MTTNGVSRDEYAGPESGPEPPMPIKLWGPVVRGFGRGSKQLGIPTANIPSSGLDAYPDLPNGVYFGYTSLKNPPSKFSDITNNSSNDVQIYPSVLSIGYNPFYNNATRSVEIHILHEFISDFYGSCLNLLILGYIRPERNYDGLQALIDDIKFDCEVARRSLKRDNWKLEDEVVGDENWQNWLKDFGWAADLSKEDVERVESRVLGGDGEAAKA